MQNNENNIKSLINNINIALDDKDETIDYEVVKSTDYKQFLTIVWKDFDFRIETASLRAEAVRRGRPASQLVSGSAGDWSFAMFTVSFFP